MTREEYLKYAEHFNKKEYDAVVDYFTPDVTVEYYDSATDPNSIARTLYGREAFIDNYRALHEMVREVLEVREYFSTDKLIFVELYTEFHAFKDSPASTSRPARKKGEITIMTNWVLYDLEDGKMKRIRIAHFRNHDPKEAKYK